MKKLRKFLLILLSVIIVIILSAIVYGFYLKPHYDGEVLSKNVKEETTVYFDDFGIPHIYANSQQDALTALGYVHAQDRLWQMELLRRIAPGRLSELFGTKALKSDKFFAGLNIDEASEKAIDALDKNSPGYLLATAYLNGINQYMEEGPKPIEFTLLGIKEEKFTIKDIYNIFGFMSFSFAMGQKTDPLLTDIRNKFGMDYLKDFGINSELNTTRLRNYKNSNNDYAVISKTIASLLDQSPIPPFVGSNSWVIGSQKTKNGKVIFANDPHIGFSQPGTWYEAHIVTPDYEMYGFYLAGTPFPLLGHNREYAYGLTMFENDDVDFFTEKNNPDNPAQYQSRDTWKNYDISKKTIKVKDSTDVVFNVKNTIHGPIMNDLMDDLPKENPVSLSWIYTQQPLHLLDAVYGLSHAKSIGDFHDSVGLIAAPGLNVMYGDAKGNVAWFASGKLYKLEKDVNPNFILNGTNGRDDKKEFLDFSQNPSAVNPSWNYVYSANNQPEAIGGYLYPGYYLPEDRAKRIDALLNPKNNWDVKSVSDMINDNVSAVSPSTVKELLSVLDVNLLSGNEKKGIVILKAWNGSNGLEDVAPTIYNKWIYCYLKNTFRDEMGKENFEVFLGTHIVKQLFPRQIENGNSPWWDDVSTKKIKETRKEVLSKSFKEAIAALKIQLGNNVSEWKWERVHTLEHRHPLGAVAALRSFFDVGPFPVSGSNEVINNQFFTFTDDGNYATKGGPSTRRIIDFSDVENSLSILPTGQSGNPLSKHYDDQAALYNAGKFRKMKMNKQEIIRSSVKLTFKPE